MRPLLGNFASKRMNTVTITWNEMGDVDNTAVDIENEEVIVKIIYDNKNMTGYPITYWYYNIMLNGKAIGLTTDNENDGTSATPMFYTEGHHTKEEYLKYHFDNVKHITSTYTVE
jgi:hypothetical protein